MNNEKVICPFCTNDTVRNLVYGLIRFQSKEDMKKFEENHFIAGCVIDRNSPAFHCDQCGKDFGTYNDLS